MAEQKKFEPKGSPLTYEQLLQWASREHEFQEATADERDHILHMLSDIQRWYWEDLPIGHFLTALLENDLMETVGRADEVNVKVLSLYAKFLYNMMPMDYKVKAKRDFP